MTNQLKTSMLQLDLAGSFAKTVQVHWDRETRSFDLNAIRHEVDELFLNRLLPIGEPSSNLRRTFRFRSHSSGAISGDEALAKAARLQQELGRIGTAGPLDEDEAHGLHDLYFRMFHSLEHEQIDKLLRGLDMVINSRAGSRDQSMSDATVRTQLVEMFPAVTDDHERLQRVHVELLEEAGRERMSSN